MQLLEVSGAVRPLWVVRRQRVKVAPVFSGERERETVCVCVCVRACLRVTCHSSVLIFLIKYLLIILLFSTCLFEQSVWIFHVKQYEFIPVEVTPALYYLISQ